MANIHIKDIVPGNVLRVALRAGKHLNPTHDRRLVVGRKRAAKNTSRTVMLAYVITNDSAAGLLTASVQGRKKTNYFTATIPYNAILYAQRQITPRDVPELREGNPGVVAFGAPYDHAGWKYQRVVF